MCVKLLLGNYEGKIRLLCTSAASLLLCVHSGAVLDPTLSSSAGWSLSIKYCC